MLVCSKTSQARRRFPAEMELLVKQKIEEAVLSEKELAEGQVLGIAGGFSGGDILFHEVCAAHAIPTLLYLTRSKEEYVGTWVTNIGCEWVERFNRLFEQLQGKCPPAVRVHLSEKLPDWLVEKQNYTGLQRNILWLLNNARAISGNDVSLIALWDRKPGSDDNSVAQMVDAATRRGVKPIILDTNELLRSVANGVLPSSNALLCG